MSNNFIMIWVGIITFVIMLVAKVPIKKITWDISKQKSEEKKERIMFYHRYNLVIYFFVIIISFALYCGVLLYLGDNHIKLCCSLKGAAISIALYAIFEHITGDMFSKNNEEIE